MHRLGAIGPLTARAPAQSGGDKRWLIWSAHTARTQSRLKSVKHQNGAAACTLADQIAARHAPSRAAWGASLNRRLGKMDGNRRGQTAGACSPSWSNKMVK